MKKNSEFHDYVLYDLFGDNPRIISRAMFGGYGLYHDGAIFGLIVDDTLYFKVNDTNRQEFISHKSKPFQYDNGKKKVTMSYWEVPEEIMENRDTLFAWMETSANISRASKKK